MIELSFDIPLAAPPQIVAWGEAVHGPSGYESFCLPNLWALHLYTYDARLILAGQEIDIMPGSIGVIPANAPVTYRYQGLSRHLFVHFHLAMAEARHKIAAMTYGRPHFDDLYTSLQRDFSSEMHTAGVYPVARVWGLLWELASPRPTAGPPSGTKGIVRKATEIIHRDLGRSLRVEAIAEEVGVSSGHLVRSFRAELGVTVVGYIQERRVRLALHLLEDSTMSVKSIAHTVGLPDLQYFNKVIRAASGRSPRAWRQ